MKTHLKMLCADDNADLRNALAQQFILEDFDVDTAVDGVDAVEKIAAGHYDIVLLDLKMPRMDGMGVLKEIKAMNKNPHVIVLTAVAAEALLVSRASRPRSEGEAPSTRDSAGPQTAAGDKE